MYAPVNEKGKKCKIEMKPFWEDLGLCLKAFRGERRVFMLGDMSGSWKCGGEVGD